MKALFITLSFILGLYFLRNNLALSIIISLIYAIFIFVRFSKKSAMFFLLVFIGGAVLGNLKFEYTSKENVYQGMVVEVKQNYFIFQSHFEKYYVYEEDTDKEIGDFLTIKSSVNDCKFTTYESQFNFQDYLKDKGVKRSLTLKDYETKFRNPIRLHSEKEKFLVQLNDPAKGLVNALIFNEKDYSSDSIKNFDELNLVYLLAVSGIYLHSLFAILTYIFGLFSSKKVAQAVPILLFSPLAFYSFPRISLDTLMIIS